LAHTYFWRRIYLKERPNFGREDLMLEHKKKVARKQHAEKEGRTTCKRKINVARRHISLTMIGLGFLTKIVMDISHIVV
jgi:hypothetical protein